MIERFDYLFSYWDFLWYILYELKLVSYNPKASIMFALFANLILLSAMLYYSYSYILFFIMAVMVTKVFPLWRVWKYPLYPKDIYAMLCIFMIYCLWLWMNQVKLTNIFKTQLNHVKENKPVGPAMYVLSNYLSFFKL
jgi:hypothetical protein